MFRMPSRSSFLSHFRLSLLLSQAILVALRLAYHTPAFCPSNHLLSSIGLSTVLSVPRIFICMFCTFSQSTHSRHLAALPFHLILWCMLWGLLVDECSHFCSSELLIYHWEASIFLIGIPSLYVLNHHLIYFWRWLPLILAQSNVLPISYFLLLTLRWFSVILQIVYVFHFIWWVCVTVVLYCPCTCQELTPIKKLSFED